MGGKLNGNVYYLVDFYCHQTTNIRQVIVYKRRRFVFDSFSSVGRSLDKDLSLVWRIFGQPKRFFFWVTQNKLEGE